MSDDMAALESEIGGLNKARANLIKDLPEIVSKRYLRIFQGRKGCAVGFLEREICNSCKRKVPAELFLRVAKSEVIEQCPSCQRLLVVASNVFVEPVADE